MRKNKHTRLLGVFGTILLAFNLFSHSAYAMKDRAGFSKSGHEDQMRYTLPLLLAAFARSSGPLADQILEQIRHVTRDVVASLSPSPVATGPIAPERDAFVTPEIFSVDYAVPVPAVGSRAHTPVPETLAPIVFARGSDPDILSRPTPVRAPRAGLVSAPGSSDDFLSLPPATLSPGEGEPGLSVVFTPVTSGRGAFAAASPAAPSSGQTRREPTRVDTHGRGGFEPRNLMEDFDTTLGDREDLDTRMQSLTPPSIMRTLRPPSLPDEPSDIDEEEHKPAAPTARRAAHAREIRERFDAAFAAASPVAAASPEHNPEGLSQEEADELMLQLFAGVAAQEGRADSRLSSVPGWVTVMEGDKRSRMTPLSSRLPSRAPSRRSASKSSDKKMKPSRSSRDVALALHTLAEGRHTPTSPAFSEAMEATPEGVKARTSASRQTPFHLAASPGTMRKLVQVSESPNDLLVLDKRGLSALHTSVDLDREDLVQALFDSVHSKYGPDAIRVLIEVTDAGGRTPIFYVRSQRMAQLLIGNGARVWHADREGNTIFYFMLRNRLTDSLQTLELFFYLLQQTIDPVDLSAETGDAILRVVLDYISYAQKDSLRDDSFLGLLIDYFNRFIDRIDPTGSAGIRDILDLVNKRFKLRLKFVGSDSIGQDYFKDMHVFVRLPGFYDVSVGLGEPGEPIDITEIHNPRLLFFISQLYRQGATHGNGSTADVIRLEAIARRDHMPSPVHAFDHREKAENLLEPLRRFYFSKYYSLSDYEKHVLEILIADLENALIQAAQIDGLGAGSAAQTGSSPGSDSSFSGAATAAM